MLIQTLGHKCSECGIVFTTVRLRHSCKQFHTTVVNKISCTYTDAERKEFAKFQRERAQYVKPYMKCITPNMYNQGRGRKTMSYMESGPCYQPNRGKNTTKTDQREVPRTSQPAPIQARPTAIGDAPATTSVENVRKENDNEPLDMSHRDLTKKTTPVDVPKEISHVDPKMGKRKRKRTLSSSSSSSSCSVSSNSSSASNDTTFSKAAAPK